MISKKKYCIAAVIIIIQSISVLLFSSDDSRVYIISSDKGVLVSDNKGKSWSDFNGGLPGKCIPIKIYTARKYIYLATFSSGLFKLKDNKWESINSPLFTRKSIYDNDPGFRKISAFASDPDDERNIAVATKHSIFRSANGGLTWKEIPMTGLKKIYYVTALSVTGETIFAATSFKGIYEFKNNRFSLCDRSLPEEPYSAKSSFTEQVSSLAINRDTLYAGFYFGGGLYFKDKKEKKFKPVSKASKNDFDSVIYDIQFRNKKIIFSDHLNIYQINDNNPPEPFDQYNDIISRIKSRNDVISATIIDETGLNPPVTLKICNPDQKARMENSKKRNAIYVSIPALKKNLDKLLKICSQTEINTFVIDMKDDFGNIYFPASSKIPSEIKSQKVPVDISTVLNRLKQNNIYSIARIVTFKDQKLYNAYNYKYAIKERHTGKPWKGVESEYWVDPYSEFVHNYNIGLAADLEKLGFNEIQFDYIRFPSDGPINNCYFSYRKEPDTYKSEILIDFLKKAKHNLNIPVSVDIYGFNSWYYSGNWIGQDIEELSFIVDVICPMVYPSHFGNRFYLDISKEDRPYRIVFDGGLRAMQMINRSAQLRPYLQAFNLLSPTWGPEYIKHQIRASKESGCSGYTLWNAAGDYTVTYTALKE